MSEKLAQIPTKPKAHSETVSPLISQGPKAPKFSMPTKPLTPSMVSKKGPEYTRHHPIKTSNTYHSISEISQGKSDNGTPLSQPLSARGSLLKHHGFIRPSPQWSNSFHIFARPSSYTIMTSPNQWLLQLTTGLPDLTDNLRDLSIKLSSGPEQLIQQKYLSWIHTIDTVMHSFLKVWQIVKREVNDSVSQLIWVFYDMSMFYLEVGNYDSSYAILKKAENILTHYCGELAEDLKYLICNAMAYELYLKERFSNALLLLQKAYRMIQDKNPSKLFDIHNRMGSVLIHMRNHSEALHHLMIARQYSELMKDENFKPKHPSDDHHTRTNAMGRLEDIPTKVESIAVMIYNTAIAHFHSKDYTSSQKQLDNLHKTLPRNIDSSSVLQKLSQHAEALDLLVKQHASSESSSASSDELEVPQQNWQPQGDMNPSRIRKLPSLNSLAAVSLFNGEGDIEVQPTTPADEVNFEISPKLK